MKQTLFLLLLIVANTFTSNAQTEQGNFLVGGNAQLNTSKNNTVISLSPSAGYFFVDNFAGGVNIDLGYTKTGEGSNAPKTTTFDFGPFLRYYVGNNNTIRPFLHGDVNFRSTKYKTTTTGSSTSTGTVFFFGPGAALFINRNVALEALAGYSHTANKNQNGSGGFAFKFGFQIYLTGAEVKTVTNTQ